MSKEQTGQFDTTSTLERLQASYEFLSDEQRLGLIPDFFFYYSKESLLQFLARILQEIEISTTLVNRTLTVMEELNKPIVEVLWILRQLPVPILELMFMGIAGSGKTYIIGLCEELIKHMYPTGLITPNVTHFTEVREYYVQMLGKFTYDEVAEALNNDILTVYNVHQQNSSSMFQGTGQLSLGFNELPGIKYRGKPAVKKLIAIPGMRDLVRVIAVVAAEEVHTRAEKIRKFVAEFDADSPGLFTKLIELHQTKLPSNEYDDSPKSTAQIKELYHRMAQTEQIKQNYEEMKDTVSDFMKNYKGTPVYKRVFEEVAKILAMGLEPLKVINDTAFVETIYWIFTCEEELGLQPKEYDILMNLSLLNTLSHFNPHADVLRVARGTDK